MIEEGWKRLPGACPSFEILKDMYVGLEDFA